MNQEEQRGEEAPASEALTAGPRVVLLALSVLATLIYFNTLTSSFHFDDVIRIVNNPKIKHLSNLLDMSDSRYIGYLSLALNYHFGRLNVFGYHLVNLLIHIANGFLVYLLVQLLFKTPRMLSSHSDQGILPRMSSRASWIAFATALLFVAHPIQTQAVTYIVQRLASLATLFYLLTVVLYLKWRLSPSHIKYRSWLFIGALVSTVLAMKTKEITFTLPFMLLLIETVFFGFPTRKRWLPLIPFLIILPIIPLSIPEHETSGFARVTDEISRLDYLTTQFRVIVTYLRLLVFPVNQNLEYEYPLYHSLFTPEVFLSFLFLFTLFSLSIYLLFSRRFRSVLFPLTGFGLLWFFLTLSIESSIIPLGRVIFEHRLYLPSVGFFMAVSALIIGGLNRRRVLGGLTVGLMILVFSIATYQRNLIWQSELTLWRDVVEKSPNKATGHLNLGQAYMLEKNLDEAIQHFNTALSLKPDSHVAHSNLGLAYQKQGRIEDADRSYRRALSFNPDFTKAYNNLGLVYQEQGKIPEAFQSFQNALNLNPNDGRAHNNLGALYKKLGRHEEAFLEFKKAVNLNPDDAEAHNNLGIAYKKMGRLEQAIQQYRTALILYPDYAEVHSNLGNAFKEQGRFPEALKEYHNALILNPDYAEGHYNLGLVYYEQEDLEQALGAFNKAVQNKPDFADAYNNLGIVYKRLGQPENAIDAFKRALVIRPDYAMAHYNLGNVYQQMERWDEAIRQYQEALRINPGNPGVYNSLGIVYGKIGRLDEAIRAFETALKLNPQFLEARKNLEPAYRNKEKGKGGE